MFLYLPIRKPEKYVERADIAIAQKDWLRAIRNLRLVIKRLGPRTPKSVFLKLARSYKNMHQYEKAEAVLQKGLKLHPNYVSLSIEQAEIDMDTEDWTSAIKKWKYVKKELGGSVPVSVYIRLCRALRHGKKFSEAQTIAKEALRDYPKDTPLLTELAESITAKKDWKNALVAWKAVLDTSVESENGAKLYARLQMSVIKRLINIKVYKKLVSDYIFDKKKNKPKIAIVTSFTEGYDTLKPHEVLDSRFNYVVYTDSQCNDMGFYDIRPLPQLEIDNARLSRYAKMHPHVLFKGYDLVVWIDSNLMIVGDIYPILDKFMRSGKAIGASIHPLRKTIYEEFKACVEAKKEDFSTMKRQVDFYKQQGYVDNKLGECNFLAFNLRDKEKEVNKAMETWWNQILKFSRRDQLSFPYSLSKYNLDWYPLTKPPTGIRNHPAFILTAHKYDYTILKEFNKLLAVQ